jgi:hypothetical protein
MTREIPVTRSSGLTLAGCITPPVCVRGVTRERRDHKLLREVLEVGLSTADPHPSSEKEPNSMIGTVTLLNAANWENVA